MTIKDGFNAITNWLSSPAGLPSGNFTSPRVEVPSKEKMEVKPWATIPDDEGSIFDTAPPLLSSEEYLKAVRSWVFACVNAISEEIANIQLHLYQKKSSGIEEIEEHPLLDLLYKVNSFTTKFDHWSLTQQYLEILGEAPWVLDRGKGKKDPPTSMYLLRPDKFHIKFDSEKIIGGYEYEISPGKREFFEVDEVIFIKYPSPVRPFRGRGTLEAAEQTVNLDKYGEQWNVNFFYNAARPDALLSTEQTLSKEQRDFLQELWSKKFQGLNNVARLAILEKGLKYQQLQLSQKDMDFLEQQKFSRDKIFSIFRVPKSIVAISDDVNRANAETHSYVFARWTIKPKMQRIVEQLNEFLVPMFGDDLFLDFDDPVPENLEVKVKKYKEALGNSGWMSINEVREEENLEPAEGGDVIYRPMASAPAVTIEQKQVFARVKNKKKSKNDLNDKYKTKIVNSDIKSRRRKKIKSIINKTLTPIIKEYLQKKDNGKIVKKKKPKDITDYEGFWTRQITIEEKYEKRIEAKLKDLFASQEKDIISKLEGTHKEILTKGFQINAINYSGQYFNEFRTKVPDIKIDVHKEDKKFVAVLLPILKNEIIDGGQYALDELDLDLAFTESDAVKKYLKKYPIKFSHSVNTTTNIKIRKALEEGIAEGEGVDKLAKRVHAIFGSADKFRSASIARTESSRAINFATVEAYKQSGVVEGKKWFTALDERTCERCSAMHGKIVDLDRNFFDKNDSFMGIDLTYDSVSQPPLHTRCRCGVVPVLLKE